MRPVTERRRAPYWTLVVFAGLLTLPFAWAVGALVAAAVIRIGFSVWRERAARRGAAASTPASALRLGVDPRGRPVFLTQEQLAAHALIAGASGAGKSTTLLRILSEQVAAGQPVVALDLKGSPAFAAGLERAAARAGRPFRVWTLDGPSSWNPLGHGNPTELKDRLVSSERFSEPHYKRAAERYVQSALQVLEAAGRRADLEGIVALMDPRRLAAVARNLDSPLGERVRDYLDSLTPDQLSGIRGLGTRLALLSESSAGRFLGDGTPGSAIDLRRGLAESEVILFSLNSSRYGLLAAQVGTLAIQDLVSVSGERLDSAGPPRPATVAIDEFSALGSDHLLALLARGRESGLSVLCATQELADLDRAGRGFREQVIGLTAVKIAHRQDVPSSAQMFAEMAGTELVWDETRQLRTPFDLSAPRGTRRQVERLRVNPNVIKTLAPGEAIMLVKTPVAEVIQVRVTPPETGPAVPRTVPARPAPAPDRSTPDRSTPAHPPVTPAAPVPRVPPSTRGQLPPARDSGSAPARRRPALPRPPGARPPGRGDQPDPGVTR